MQTKDCIFIVEGQCEQRFIQSICPGMRVWSLGTNGKKVPHRVIAARIVALTKPWTNRARAFYILFDREARPESSEELIKIVRAECVSMDLDISNFLFGAPDKMIENWMLADPAAIVNYLGIQAYTYEYEGRPGKGILKGLFASQKKKYFESTDGPAILRSCDHSVIRNNSPSAASFLDQIVLPCAWLGTGNY